MFITILLSASIHGLRPYNARHYPGTKLLIIEENPQSE